MKVIVLGFITVIGVVFLTPLMGALGGIFCGWVVGLLFEETILGILEQIGITGYAMWQVGLFLGFVGGFFKSNHSSKKE